MMKKINDDRLNIDLWMNLFNGANPYDLALVERYIFARLDGIRILRSLLSQRIKADTNENI